jgi:hypothetical protein
VRSAKEFFSRASTEEGRHRAWSKDVRTLRRATHAQAAANFIAGAGNDRLRGLESAGDDLALGEDIAADPGDLDAAGRALDEADAQTPLQLATRLLSFDFGSPVARDAAEKPPWRTTCVKYCRSINKAGGAIARPERHGSRVCGRRRIRQT